MRAWILDGSLLSSLVSQFIRNNSLENLFASISCWLFSNDKMNGNRWKFKLHKKHSSQLLFQVADTGIRAKWFNNYKISKNIFIHHVYTNGAVKSAHKTDKRTRFTRSWWMNGLCVRYVPCALVAKHKKPYQNQSTANFTKSLILFIYSFRQQFQKRRRQDHLHIFSTKSVQRWKAKCKNNNK